MIKKYTLILLFTIFIINFSFATHERAGEITYKWVSGLTYEITIITYTYSPSLADRDELTVNWGDGTSGIIYRISKEELGNDIRKNIYSSSTSSSCGRHTFPAPGTYIISMEDPNRNAGIYNIPNSVNVPFYIETEIVINPFLGVNNSLVLLNPPIDEACIHQPYMHNPWAYDVDGDSLSYRLAFCKGQGGMDIPGYTYPAGSVLQINPITGDLLWDSPQINTEYNIAIIIEEWRKGVKIGSVRRDMQINVIPCTNEPPKLYTINDTCITAGDTLSFIVSANDSPTQTMTLTGNGTPIQLTQNPASFPQPTTGQSYVFSTFTWYSKCTHVKKQAYQMNFKVTDNGYPKLVSYKTTLITIVCPRPENLIADAVGNSIHLSWNQEVCTNAIGYKIFRHNGYTGFIPNHCETGIPAYTGYVQIADIPDINTTNYIDDNNGQGLVMGNEYCYMVYAYFSDGAESYASLEACAELQKDVPVITNVSVRNTHPVEGSIFVGWSKPSELDTTLHHGPFKYYILRGQNSNFSLIDSLNNINDTVYIDTLLNTQNLQYKYKIDFYNDSINKKYLIGCTNIAYSIFLSIVPTDKRLDLSWNVNVPWQNMYYVIYRFNTSSSVWDSIGYSYSTNYSDLGLINGETYCYKIKSVGKYTASGLPFPLINYSEANCAIPIDNIPPCPPVLNVTPNCSTISNFIWWYNPNDSCSSDVISYTLYYAESEESDYLIIYNAHGRDDTTFLHTGLFTIAGCYYVTSADSNGNISSPSNLTCVDITMCDLYKLPNAFSPNGDGFNDFFRPYPYNFVENIKIYIYNRWGELEFTTENPDINWDGKNYLTKISCSVGVYYFVCDVYERRLKGIEKRTITGNIQLLR